jgi:hypothetical protein
MSTLLSPRIVTWMGNDIEVSAHVPSEAVRRDLRTIFPSQEMGSVIALPTNQRAREDLVGVGPRIEDEKDRLLLSFMSFAAAVTTALSAKGYFCDYIDPCSGLSCVTQETNKYYDEVNGMQAMLQYRVMNAGCCKILLHPSWGSSVYPATLFTSAPLHEVLLFLENATQHQQ